jgi:hypothetical protein
MIETVFNLLITAGIDAKTAALIWFAISYQKRLVTIENSIKELIVKLK